MPARSQLDFSHFYHSYLIVSIVCNYNVIILKIVNPSKRSQEICEFLGRLTNSIVNYYLDKEGSVAMRCIQNWMKLGPQIVITVYFHQCCGSVTVWYGSGPRISTSVKRIQIRLLLFPSVTFKVATKLLKVFLLITYFLKATFRKTRSRIRTSYLWIRSQETQKHTDPDPQHWLPWTSCTPLLYRF